MLRSSHPPSCGFASKINALRACRCVPGACSRLASRPSMPGFRGAGCRLGRCMRSMAAATPPSTAQRPRCSPPARGADQGQDPLVHHPAGFVRAGASPGRSRSGPRHLRRRLRREIGAGVFRGRGPSWWTGCGGCRGRAAFDDVVAAVVARCGSVRFDRDRDRGETVATADRGRGFRTADRVGDKMAGVDVALDTLAGAGRGPSTMAARVDPMPRRRKRGLCSGCV